MFLYIKRYIRSKSTLVSLIVGSMFYLTYGVTQTSWNNLSLIGVSIFIAIFLPLYSKMSNKIEEFANLKTALVTVGRIGRFIPQFVFNFAVFYIFYYGGVFPLSALEGIGGIAGIALFTTLSSQGAQYIALVIFNRGFGDQNRNVLIALSANIFVTALATTGLDIIKPIFIVISISLGILIFGVGAAADVRAQIYPKRGVGIFFGTFNPFHTTHVQIVKNALVHRNLSKVIIHPTIVPKIHAKALERGEIHVAETVAGLDVFKTTDKADANVNYFPTGNRFYPPQTRKLLIELALIEAGLQHQVEVMWAPQAYQNKGFYGIIAQIKKAHPNQPLHGLHGSDLGGMWVRSIYDECGWIYPMPIRRQDNVSATAIRGGAKGMTTSIVGQILEHLALNHKQFEIDSQKFSNEDGVLSII